MSDEEQGFVEARELRGISRQEALALVDQLLGDSTLWPSPLAQYRLTSDFQSDWKEEVGHWLHTAQVCGFADALVARVPLALDVGRGRKGSIQTISGTWNSSRSWHPRW